MSNPETPVPGKGGLASVVADDFSVWEAVGGVRGLIEAVLPSILFVVVFTITGETVPAVLTAVGTFALCLIIRLIQRIDITPALSGAIGVLISAVWAWRSGEAENYFAMGLWTNGAYLAGLLISIIVRWPIIGVAVSLLKGEDQSWRTDPQLAPRKRRYYLATWLWVGMFALRLAVQLPLYLAEDQVEALGIARVLMGPFLFGIVAWFTWILCREPGQQIVVGEDAGDLEQLSQDNDGVAESQDRAANIEDTQAADDAPQPDGNDAAR